MAKGSKPASDVPNKDLSYNGWGFLVVPEGGGMYVKPFFKLAILIIAILAVAGAAQAADNTALVQELLPKGSVLFPVVGSNASQHVFLIVRDQNLNPVEGAASLLTVYFPNEVQEWVMPNTDEFGLSRLSLEIKNQPPGTRVMLEFHVGFDELEASTRDSFRIWW